jgi:hypothetical protein
VHLASNIQCGILVCWLPYSFVSLKIMKNAQCLQNALLGVGQVAAQTTSASKSSRTPNTSSPSPSWLALHHNACAHAATSGAACKTTAQKPCRLLPFQLAGVCLTLHHEVCASAERKMAACTSNMYTACRLRGAHHIPHPWGSKS